ncbi:hypothetical protein [Aeromonas sp. MR16]|uniref:hypothetical protein n=1 Tax=Aeromonas sp. MR16 TaxID=2923420 RepID=UPI001F4BB2AD|nr:hypothetical protein [Aeromonas sp. MR16]MCH7369880.1 hypothetical protein [Aeromonas sp. MR16]
MSQNERYYFELLVDVQALLSTYSHEDSQLKKQLKNLLNRKAPDGNKPFMQEKHFVD